MGRIRRPPPRNPREVTGYALEDAARAFAKNRVGRGDLVKAALRYAKAVAEDGNLPARKRPSRTIITDDGEE